MLQQQEDSEFIKELKELTRKGEKIAYLLRIEREKIENEKKIDKGKQETEQEKKRTAQERKEN